jgi:acetyl-CoA acetyltransferase
MLSMGRDSYIVDAVRSLIGRRNGSLSEIRADELAAQILNGLSTASMSTG